MPGRFRLTKSKFQILLFIQILSFPLPFPNFANFSNFFLPNFANFSKFFQFFQFPVFSFFSKFFLYPLIWFLPRAVVFFNKMIAVAPKILLFFQILTAIFSWDWSWEFDMSWSGPRQKFLKLENFSRYLQLGKELESWDYFSFKLPKISKFWKS